MNDVLGIGAICAASISGINSFPRRPPPVVARRLSGCPWERGGWAAALGLVQCRVGDPQDVRGLSHGVTISGETYRQCGVKGLAMFGPKLVAPEMPDEALHGGLRIRTADQ